MIKVPYLGSFQAHIKQAEFAVLTLFHQWGISQDPHCR